MFPSITTGRAITGGNIVHQLQSDHAFFKKAQDWLSEHPRKGEIIIDMLDTLGSQTDLKRLEEFLKPLQKNEFKKYMAALKNEIANSPDYEPYEGNFNYQKEHMRQRLQQLETPHRGKAEESRPEIQIRPQVRLEKALRLDSYPPCA